MNRLLLTWSDAGTLGPAPAHQGRRPDSDRGPVQRLLDQDESRYDAIVILTIPAGEAPSRALAERARARAPRVELRVVDVDDPSDHAKLFRAVGPLAGQLKRAFPEAGWAIDVLLSAGTPQAQTIWVILVQAGILPARMLQVIPAAFVPRPHPRPVREVRLDIEGFPEIRALREEVVRLRAEARTREAVLVGESEPMRALRARVARVAATDVPVLIVGETGTGKELVARAIHEHSPRRRGPFIAENCGVFAEGVLASELFGHEAGAFTGAAGRRRGVFEQAHGGTLFLDEIGELSPRVQASLLRVLQDGTLRRVGGEAKIELDVRVVAATHRDLAAMVADGAFREDLVYRLRGAILEVPPLRERGGDIEILVEAFLDEVRARRKGRGLEVTREALRRLHHHPWPGNVRELRAEVHRWGVFCDDTVDAGDLSPEITSPPARPAGSGAGVHAHGAGALGAGAHAHGAGAAAGGERLATLAEAVESAERAAIARALDAHQGNISRAARALGIDRNTLKRKRAAYGLGSASAPRGRR
ncbi:sigma-54 dependent transcriptional regulator [Sorangium sp. So ce1036]|uniref:sigma-54 interaction domain-containing protein n=1 Tax=Sorangium sp. So ce1036 TaxID=3133328 RepID=UPI003F0177E4